MNRVQRMTVGDVMTRDVLSVGPDTSFRDVATTLFAGAVRAVPVLDADRRLPGVLGRSTYEVDARPSDLDVAHLH